jgi:hypothetical protein
MPTLLFNAFDVFSFVYIIAQNQELSIKKATTRVGSSKQADVN